jgi:hypothetical protein
MLNEAGSFACPWCGEINHVDLDPGDAGQWLTQDCAVCCSPIEIRLPADGSDTPEVRRE